MLIRMIVSKMGSVDGCSTALYKAGEKYDIPESLAGVFLHEGWAEEDKELVLETKNETPPKGGAGNPTGKSGKRRKQP